MGPDNSERFQGGEDDPSAAADEDSGLLSPQSDVDEQRLASRASPARNVKEASTERERLPDEWVDQSAVDSSNGVHVTGSASNGSRLQDREKTEFVTSERRDLTYDDVLTSLGQFGRYQKRTFLLLALLYITGCAQTLISVFTLAIPDHRCALPVMHNDTWKVQSDHHVFLINTSIPPGQSSPYDSCSIYTHSRHHHHLQLNNETVSVLRHRRDMSDNSAGEGDNHTEHTQTSGCDRYVYDTSTYRSTIATEMNMVCSKALHRSHAQMMMMVGSVVGQIIGPVSDTYGRKPVNMISGVLHIVVAFTLSWTSNYSMLMALMFFMGFSITGMLNTAFVMSMELVGPSKRKWAGYGLMSFWAVGMILLAPLAYGLRDWQHLQLTTSLVAAPILSYWWFIPESARWLVNRGRIQEAEVIIRKAAQVNGVTLPPDVMSRVRLCDTAGVSLLRAMVNSLAYYGLSWNVGTLGGSVYINFLLSGVVELVSFAGCLLLLDRIGRRALNCALMLLAGVTCTGTIFPVLYGGSSLQWLTILLAMIGKLGIAGSFGTIWVFSSELFPTVLRNSGMGASSLFARIGGIIAPYIANLGQTIGGDAATAVPLVIFGVASILAGLLLLYLPETLNKPLPETIQDSIEMNRKRGKKTKSSVRI